MNPIHLSVKLEPIDRENSEGERVGLILYINLKAFAANLHNLFYNKRIKILSEFHSDIHLKLAAHLICHSVDKRFEMLYHFLFVKIVHKEYTQNRKEEKKQRI